MKDPLGYAHPGQRGQRAGASRRVRRCPQRLDAARAIFMTHDDGEAVAGVDEVLEGLTTAETGGEPLMELFSDNRFGLQQPGGDRQLHPSASCIGAGVRTRRWSG